MFKASPPSCKEQSFLAPSGWKRFLCFTYSVHRFWQRTSMLVLPYFNIWKYMDAHMGSCSYTSTFIHPDLLILHTNMFWRFWSVEWRVKLVLCVRDQTLWSSKQLLISSLPRHLTIGGYTTWNKHAELFWWSIPSSSEPNTHWFKLIKCEWGLAASICLISSLFTG